jgi:hypothetical protein
MAGDARGDSEGEDMGDVCSVMESSQLPMESPRGLYSKYGVEGYIIGEW